MGTCSNGGTTTVRRILLLLALVGGFSFSARAQVYTTVQSASSSTAAVNTVNLSFPGNSTTGNLLIACTNFGNNAAGSTYTVTDNKSGGSNTYTTFPTVKIGLTSLNDLTCAWAIHSGASATLQLTIACTPTGTCGTHTLRFAIIEKNSSTGFLASPVDQSAGQSTTSSVTSGDPTNITPTVSNSFMFSAIQLGVAAGTSSIIVGGGCTEEPTSNGSAGNGWAGDHRADGADSATSGLSPTKCTYSWTNAGGYSSIAINFKPAISGPTSVLKGAGSVLGASKIE